MENGSKKEQEDANQDTKEEITREVIAALNKVEAEAKQERKEIEGLRRTARRVFIAIPSAIAVSLFLAFVFLVPHQAASSTAPGGYTIEDLQGDTINTWVSWNLLPGNPLSVNIVDTAGLPQDKIDVVKDAIISNGTVVLDDSLFRPGMAGSSTYYAGWEGALHSVKNRETEYYIPASFQITQVTGKVGDVTIYLVRDKSPDGLSGYTKNVVDGNQILTSKITIYEADRLPDGQLAAISRHEFGHALGLAHSAAQYDLMHATIETQYPFISQCDIQAVSSLYAGNESSQVVCDR